MKNFNLIQMTEVMKKHKLCRIWKYAAMITLLLTLACGNVWGQTFNTTSPNNKSITTNNITVSSSNSIQSKTFNGTASTAVWKIDSNPISITSTTANIYKLVFTACYSSSGTSMAQSCKVSVSTDGSTYSTLSSGVSVSGGTGTSSTNTAKIYVSGYGGYSTVTVTFSSTLYRYVRIEKDGKETWVNSIKVYTAPTALTKGVATETTCPMTVTDGGNTVNYEFYYNTASTAPTSGSTATATFTSKTPTLTSLSDGTTYYCWVRSKYSNTEKSPWKALTGSTFTTDAAPAGSGWGIAGTMNSWTAATNEMTGSGTVSTTISLSANTQYEFKIVDITNGDWYGNGGTIKGGITDWLFETSKGNTYLRTSCAGDYTFTFNTSTKNLSITYPNSNKVYFAKGGASWTNIYAYCYNDGDWNIGWPGIEITSNTEDHCGTEYYAYTNGYTYIIFNNGSGGDGNQTGNITVAGYEGKHAVGAAATGWSAYPTYTISYNNGGGSGSMSSQTGIACGTDKATTANTFTRDGYSFTGWNADVDVTVGGSTKTAGTLLDDGVTIEDISSNITLTAQWEEEVTYTVTYSLNGGKYNGSSTAPTQAAVASGTEITLPSLTPTKEGYVFASWKCSVGNTYHWESYSYTMTAANTTFTAQWVAAASLVSGTLYYTADIVPLSLNNAISATNQYAKGISSNGVFTSLGNPLRTSNSDGTMEINKKDKQTVDGYNFYDHMWFKGGPEKSGVVPSSRAVKFTIPTAGTLSIYCTRGDRILLSNGTTASTLTDNTSGNIIRRDVDVTAGTYYLYANNSGTSLAGLKFVEESCSATQPGTIGKGTLSACSLRLTAAGSPASNNTWYWQSSADGTDKTESGATKDVTSTGTYYIRSFCSTGSGCWSDAQTVTVSASDLTPAAPTALAAASPTAKGVTLTVTDAANTNDYEFYVNTSSSAPSAGTSASYTSTSKSVTITDKYAGTTFYAWARAKCGSNKSAWTALGDGGTFTTSTVTMTPTLTNVTKNSGAESGIGGSDYTAEFEADDEYSMPDPTVTIGGNAATSGTDYTWSVVGSVGTITIPANKINGNIAITLNSADAAPSSAVISGTYHYFPGDNISLTCTPSGNNGPTTYQWYKGGQDDEDEIDGATSATYTKNSCAFADAGKYYCKVTCNETSIWAETNDAEDYDVKILHLYVKTGRNGSDYGDVDFTKVDGSTATASISLGSNWDYGFNIADGCGHYYGNSGKMTEDDCTDWSMDVDGTDCLMRTTNGATYTFTVDYSNLEEPVVSISYPSANQAADKVIYFDNQTVQWSTLHYRIGRSDHTQATAMSTKVPGTNNLYSVTTAAYNNFSGWHIANNAGWTGSNSIYRTDTDGDAYEITYATAHEGGAVTDAAITVTPTTSRGKGSDEGINDNCTFYNYTITTGMKTDRVTISPYSNGTITVNYVDTDDEEATLTSGYADLAHTVILTSISAEAEDGYDASAVTINGGSYSTNYVVTGATTIAATFTPHVYTITLNKGDHGASNQSATVAYLADELTTITHVSSTGYTLTGYYDGSTKVLNANGTFAGDDITGYITDGKWSKTANATLTAKWEAKTTTLIFDANTTYHGTAGDGGATATYDATALASVTHTTPAAGYQLDGYYTTATSEGTKIVTASGTLVASTSYTTAGGAWQSALANLTLYARYTDKSYDVTHTFSNASRSSGGTAGTGTATHGTDYSVIVAATSGYVLPSTITVTIGGKTATSGTEYTWNQGTGTVTIGGSYITGDIVITITSNVECPASASGAVVYKWVTKSSGLGTDPICTNKDQDYPLTTGSGNPLETLTGGTLTARASSAGTTNLKYNGSSINFNGGASGWLILGLNCAIQSGDVIRYVNSNSGSVAIHTAQGTSTNEIVLAGNSKTTVQTVVITSAQATAFSGLKTIYMERKSNTSDISYFEIIRPYVVTLDANTNGGEVNGENTEVHYAASGEEIVLPHAVKAGYYFNGWFAASTGGVAVSNPYTPTGTTTLYAQYGDCPEEGTAYKFQVASSGLTNGSVTANNVDFEFNIGNYLTTLNGGTLTTGDSKASYVKIADNSTISLEDNGAYLKVDLDCELEAGDKFVATVASKTIYVTKNTTRAATAELPVGTKQETDVPAALVGEKTLYIWRGSGTATISYFEVVKPTKYDLTYNDNTEDVVSNMPDNARKPAGTITLASEEPTRSGYVFQGWTEDPENEGTVYAAGGSYTMPSDDQNLYAKWTTAYTLTYNKNTSDAVSNLPAPESVAAGSVTLSSSVPTRANYRFVGWNEETDGSGATTYDAGATYTMPARNKTLYAIWQEAATLKWNLNVNTAESSIGTASKESTHSGISNSTNMTNLANYGSLTITSAKKEGLTSKIATPASYDAGKYMYVTFTVPANYEFVPSSASVKVQPVGENEHKAVILELSDANGHSISNTPVKCDGTTSGKTTTVTLSNDGGVAFEGTVTLKIYVYAHADASVASNNCYRMGSPIAISGDINYVCPERATITSPTAPQSIKLYTDRTKTLTVEATPYSTGTLTYQWQKDGVNIVGATSASYTVVGSGLTAGTTYVYTCDVSQTSPDACATVTSPAFNITAASPDCGYTVIAGATRTSGATTVASHEGVLYKEAVFNTDNTGKISGGKYVYLELTSGHYFQNGDKVVVTITTKSDQGTKELNVCAGSTTPGTCLGVLAAENVKENDDNEVVLSNVPENTSTITIHRTGNSTTQNHYVDAIKVKRYGCPDIFIYDDAAGTSEWSDEDNWIGAAGHGSGLPTSEDRIFINKSVTVDVATAAAAEMNITNGSMVTVEKSITVGDVNIETGSTLNVAKDGEDGITVATNSLYLKGGWNDSYTTYDMPRVYIDPASTLTKVVNTVNFDISVDSRNYYPIAVPYPVNVSAVDYVNSTLATASQYGKHYVIKKYDGANRAESGEDRDNNWVIMKDGTIYGAATETLQPGVGYILTAVSIPEYGGGVIRFPMSFTNDWTTGGEKGTVSDVTKNVIAVTAHTGAAATSNQRHAGWNMLGVPFMSCYGAGEDMYADGTLINGEIVVTPGDEDPYSYDNTTIPYVSVPSHDFAEYIQTDITDAELRPGWSFFVQVAESGDLTFAVSNQQDNDDGNPIYAPKRTAADRVLRTGIVLSGAETSDKTTILVSDKYSAADYEINADLEKLFGNGYTLATYSLSGSTRLAYNAMSKNDATAVIPIGYRAPAEGEYTFSINPRYAENGAFSRVDLIDYEAGTVTNLLYGSYTFESARTQNDTRFALNVVLKPTITTDVENGANGENDANGVEKVIIDDHMYIIRSGKMYDATGKCVKGGQK